MRFFSFILILHFLFRLWLSSFGGLHPDEAYYWTWAQQLQWGYFDHPPMIAWLIYLSNKFIYAIPFLPEDSITLQYIAFRAFPFFMGFVLTPYMIAKSVVFIQKKDLRMTQGICLITLPYILGAPQVITPDIPLFFFWSCALFVVLQMIKGRGRALWSERVTPFQPQKAILLGVILALAAYSKYTSIFLALLLPVSGLGFYNSLTTAFVAFVLLIPHLLWTAEVAFINHMGMFFQFGNAFNGFMVKPKFNFLFDLWGMQIAFWGPLLFLFLFALISKKHRFVWVLLWWTFLPLIFFSITSLRRYVEGNWPLMGAIAASVWFLSAYYKSKSKIMLVSIGHLVFYALAIVAIFNLDTVTKFIEPIDYKLAKKLKKPSRINEFKGWSRMRDILYEVTLEDDLPIAVDRYQTMSPLLFYDRQKPGQEQLKDRLKIWYNARRSQFNYDEDFMLKPDSEEYYLLSEKKKRAPEEICEFLQKIEKTEEESYYLSKCKI